MSVVLDQNRKAIPLCNTYDEGRQLHFYVNDPNEYVSNKKQLDGSKSFTLIGVTVFILLLCIFTLNLASAGWSAGNILTFGLVIVAMYFVTLYAKRWLMINSRLHEMKQYGSPCIQMEKDAQMVHCNVAKNV